ncbi:hypothetical protein ERO13_A09G099350v2 [Gossypium hirsutum]|nr:hypothetical protein ERO13_A09G099350v2 [Gossypium hirsutum]
MVKWRSIPIFFYHQHDKVEFSSDFFQHQHDEAEISSGFFSTLMWQVQTQIPPVMNVVSGKFIFPLSCTNKLNHANNAVSDTELVAKFTFKLFLAIDCSRIKVSLPIEGISF